MSAHQLDEYLQATLVSIEPNEIRLDINLTPGVEVADQVLGVIDRDHNAAISEQEAVAYAVLLKRDLVAALDGQKLKLDLAEWTFPEFAELKTGWGIIQIQYSLKSRMIIPGQHSLVLENRHLRPISAYLFNAARPGSSSIQILAQKRNYNQSVGEIEFVFRAAPPTFGIGAFAASAAAMACLALFIALCLRVQKP